MGLLLLAEDKATKCKDIIRNRLSERFQEDLLGAFLVHREDKKRQKNERECNVMNR
jgi:hypothetical protein